MRPILLAAATVLALALPNLLHAQSNLIPLSDPVVTDMLNDPTSTQLLADLEIITATTSGILVDCGAGQAVLASMRDHLEALGRELLAARSDLTIAMGDPHTDFQELIPLRVRLRLAERALREAQEELRGPMGLLHDLLDAAGC